MTTDDVNGRVTLREVYELVQGLEAKLDKRLDGTDEKVERLNERVSRVEGGIAVIKWLGPSGVAALIVGLLKSTGVI